MMICLRSMGDGRDPNFKSLCVCVCVRIYVRASETTHDVCGYDMICDNRMGDGRWAMGGKPSTRHECGE